MCHQLPGLSLWPAACTPSPQALYRDADAGDWKPQACAELSTKRQAVPWGEPRGMTVGADAGQETQEKEEKGKKVQNQHLQSSGHLTSMSTSDLVVIPVLQVRELGFRGLRLAWLGGDLLLVRWQLGGGAGIPVQI